MRRLLLLLFITLGSCGCSPVDHASTAEHRVHDVALFAVGLGSGLLIAMAREEQR